MRKVIALFAFLLVILGSFAVSKADEGMWLLSNLPVKELQSKYNFTPTAQWVETVQLSSARLPNCSASFVSSNGLVMTNGHCAEEAVQALSTPQNNFYEKGFYAKTLADERKTGLNLKVLVSVEARGAQKPGLICEEVVLYQGGQYNSYCYKVYDDVRLVFATEKNAWFFGGDADNFEYPRFTLDVSFLRAYENDKPASTPNHFRWSKSGAKEGELIFVSGHPGSTKRLLTPEALVTERDTKVPFLLDMFRRREITTQQFMLRSRENERIAKSDLFSWQNARKLYVGKIRGLHDPRLMDGKLDFANKVLSDNSIDPAIQQKFREGRDMVADTQKAIRDLYPAVVFLLSGQAFDSRLFGYAQSIVSGDKEMAKAVLEARAGEPSLNLEYEEAKLADSITHFVEVLGVDDLTVQDLLFRYHRRPSDVARLFVQGTKLSDINQHTLIVQELAVSGTFPTGDLMVGLAQLVQRASADYANEWRAALIKERQGYAKISEALFAIYGTSVYPDATFTLRLSFGTVSGYAENGKQLNSFTTLGEAFDHAVEFGNSGDHQLPDSWVKSTKLLKLTTPLNFVSNLDITGGNSGSPVFNKDLEIVGIVFDSNIQGLVSDYDFKYDQRARSISVHSAGILEVLAKIYGANRLVRELTR
ncbi:MAG: hypothetical protein A3B99_05130 [Candidatus Yanofskybacteria bacterium RIFCSPHIGHO2_02_FULL_44_12b]|uniref:Dipeptidyl-peptidase n=2 Tax=Candidatus Yanofskyibacteriota TaxID=1752733 RepID=A0A1F8GK34_9BACT|nr:MAG: hypothetical protein UW79_C0023G0021 [Candidatus Yanofskybacteria bacterium GW2011_GWA2_44_9]OGN04263.1 MAG: hypothetical protein A2659_03185 [Candidatus Yanofskybacteria bacterium RIFCSPHIGHO2_01_FULL_44_24]OGN14369.1 MAG: hypothetical protein A3B99_05130 [Candidatus Yanofskybacteria bacterium RIFCSPHIGHO2_02_FULL_44_12b]OGN25370.1 MAG: hypothetical protein A2925_00695 [Candidatus Yanofskybacteria bacterium RIFCSPLOWO2_01_FULL_44_22]